MNRTDISIREEVLAEIDNDNLVVYLGNGVSLEDSVEKRVILFKHKVERACEPRFWWIWRKFILIWDIRCSFFRMKMGSMQMILSMQE